MRSKPGTRRRAQTATKGLGQHFKSPRHLRDKGKTQLLVPVSIVDIRHRRLLARLHTLESKALKTLGDRDSTSQAGIQDDLDDELEDDVVYFDPMDPDYFPSDKEDEYSFSYHGPPALIEDDVNPDAPDEKMAINPHNRRVLPDPPAQRLYASWKALIPTLVISHQHYTSRMLAKPLSNPPASLSLCNKTTCTRKNSKLLCLFFNHFVTIDIVSCECFTAPEVLVHFGLFPTAPSQPQMAVSLDLLSHQQTST